MRNIEDIKQAKREVKDVPHLLLRTDGGTQYRDGIDDETMREYLDAIKDGAVFPPIETVFDGQHHWVVDGFHRLAAYSRRGCPFITVSCIQGSLEEARLLALGANAQHGLRRDSKTKRRIVQQALQHPAFKGESNYVIAKFCGVSFPFVAAVRNPEIKERQKKNRDRSNANRVIEQTQGDAELKLFTSSSELPKEINPQGGEAPSKEEIEAAEEAFKADQDMMYKLLESDEPLRVAVDENKRLSLRVAQLEARLRGLMNERNECVRMVKSKEREVERLRGDLRNLKPTRSDIALSVESDARKELVESLRASVSD
jgi:hypothetical protein